MGDSTPARRPIRLNIMSYIRAACLGFVVALTVGSGIAEAQQALKHQASWRLYKHPTLGFCFRHPQNLKPVARDVESFHIEGLVAVIDLMSGGNSPTVLRFMASEPAGNPLAVNYDRAFLRKVCKTYSTMKIGDAEAVNCVSCGRAACHWTVHTLGRRQMKIFTLRPNDAEKAGPQNGTFPLLAIIKSLEVSKCGG